MSNWITYVMIVMQVVLFAVTIWEGQTGKALYWGGAAILTFGVTVMKG
jgi:hypothetical protein